MSQTRKKTSIYAGLINFFKSKAVRNITLTLLLICSVLGMFLLDKLNLIRDQYLPFLNDNFISFLITALNISRFNITMSAWLVFLSIALLVVIIILGNIFSLKFVDKKADDNWKKFKSYNSAYRFYAFLYYSILTLICAAIIFVVVMLGGFKSLQMNAELFINLLYVVLLCLMFLLLIPISIFLVYFIIKVVMFIVSFIISRFALMVKDINAGSDLHQQKSEEFLAEARRNSGIVIPTNSPEFKQQPKFDNPTSRDIFLPLTLIDQAKKEEPTKTSDIAIEDLALRFQAFAINNHQIYYELPIIRSYIAGLATSRLIILEGLSGTGKSMLPRMFAEFTSSKAYFSPVQATWRDKTDLLGFYSEFSKTFKTTDFMKNLYSASYSDKINELVLDEINLSRMEYYFADFLSILEYPQEDWKIKVYDPEQGQKLPQKLKDGYIKIPNNTWFIGTANTDDSTFTITDKVYDRAVIIDFAEKFSPIASSYNSDPIEISAEDLTEMFDKAKSEEAYRLNATDHQKFIKICDFIRDAFEIKFGNRIMVQIETFVPVYVALGGTKEEAIDFMLARKILRKLQGAYQDYVKEELAKLKNLIEQTYGKGVFKETEKLIAKILKRLV